MTELVYQFKSINRKLNRQEQKAEFEAKNPKVEPSTYGTGWPFTVAVPMMDQMGSTHAGRLTDVLGPVELPDLRGRVVAGVDGGGSASIGRLTGGGACETKTLVVAELPDLRAKAEALAQQIVDSYELSSRPLALKSAAHPEWPYAGTSFEWTKFVKAKI